MQESNESPVWDLVICIAASVGSVVFLLWAYLSISSRVPMLWGGQVVGVLSIIMAVMSLSMAIGSGYQWKHRR
jgi:small neutral amino acid transporter SnatA (MarC family)